MKNMCVKLGGLGALLICLPVIYQISRGDIFNSASYFLWSMLSVICVVVLIRAKKGGYTMMVGYVFSDLSIAVYAYIKSGQVNFAIFEWFIVLLTMICASIYVWCELRKNYTPAVIANATAMMVAGVPQIADSFQNPYKMNVAICGGYMVISMLSYYGERPNVNARLIPGLSIIYWIVIIVGLVIARSSVT